MSKNFQKQGKLKQNNNYLLSKNSRTTKKANSQKKYLNSPDIITQLSKQIPYYNNFSNFYSNNQMNYLNMNLLHQQALTPVTRKKNIYGDDFLLPQKSAKFEGKKTLVLDIDETLVHSSFLPFEKNDLILNVNFDGIFYNIYVLVRPWAEQFIKEISKYFEIITFTASIPAYASPLLDILDKEKNIQHRLYREHCTFINGLFIKDLKRLNRNLKDVIIVDNSPLAFAFDTENGLPINSWFDDPVDQELMNIKPLLEFLAKTQDVRQYIKKFVKNNAINYEIANKIIKENRIKNEVENTNELTSSKNKKINKNDKNKYIANIKNIKAGNINNKNNNIIDDYKTDKNNEIKNLNENSIEKMKDNNIINDNFKNVNEAIKNLCAFEKDLQNEKINNNNEKEDNENIEDININNNTIKKNTNTNLNANKNKKYLYNNFFNKKDFNSPLINYNMKNNNINLNDIKKIFDDNNSANLKIDKNKDQLLKRNNMRNNKSNKNSLKNINKKNNIFRLGIKINESNNIMPISNNFCPQFKRNKKMENDFKINDNNVLMPNIFPSTSNTSKYNNYHIIYSNSKNFLSDKVMKPIDNLLKNKNKNNKTAHLIKSMSLKEALEDKNISVKQFKYINLIDKFENNNIKMKSSSFKLLNQNNDLSIKNYNGNIRNNNHRSSKYRLKNNLNNINNVSNTNINNNLRMSSKPKISTIINRGFEINNTLNRNKLNEIYSQALRSKSTGNFIKLKSAQIKTSKHNSINNNNIKSEKEEENKIFLRNNNKSNSKNNKNELVFISGYNTPNNVKI